MEEFMSVLTGVLVPVLVVLGLVVRMVNSVRKPPENEKSAGSAQTPPIRYARPSVPAMTGTAQGPAAGAARQPVRYTEGSPLKRSSLEGNSLEGREGSIFDRAMGERTGLENRMGMAHTEVYSRRRTQNVRPAQFKLSRDTLIEGIVYSEILGKPGGRRARR